MVHGTDATHSPNEIPPRFSSAGVKTPSRVRATARPVSEIAWLASTHTRNTPPLAKRPSAMYTAQIKPSRRSGRQESKPLPHPDPANIGADLIHQRKPQWSEQKESILLGPYDYMVGNPGKDIRSQLIAAFDAWLQVPKASLDIITEVVGMLHTASLLVDDVEDSSSLRRGEPVAHAIYGTAQTINSANYVYFLALKEIGKLNNPRAIAVYTEEMVNLHRGQGMDLWWRDSLTCPSEDDYLEMVSNKTGGLFRLAVKLMQTESSNPAFVLSSSPLSGSSTPSNPSPTRRQDQTRPDTSNPLVPLVNTIGLLYQVLDDYQNLASTTYTANKGLAEDLTEGKFSFLIAHAIRSDPSDQTLPSILQQRTKDDDVKRFAVRFIEKSGSFEYSRQVLQVLEERALHLIDEVDAWDARTAQSSPAKEASDQSRRSGDGVRTILEKLRVQEPVAHVNGNGTTNSDGNSS